MREIILDTETTGLDARGGDRLVEIGAVEMVNLFATGRTFHRYINPDRPVPRQAYEIHGLSDAFLADKPRFDDIADDFLGFIGDGTLVIHNAGFDMGFINMELKKTGRPTIAETRVIDTLMLARRKFPGSPSSLDALCSRFAIDNAHRTKHGALLDSELLAEVYIELRGGRQASLGLIDDDDRPHAISDHAPVRPRTRPLAARLSEEERAAHRAMIESIGDKAIWNRYRSD